MTQLLLCGDTAFYSIKSASEPSSSQHKSVEKATVPFHGRSLETLKNRKQKKILIVAFDLKDSSKLSEQFYSNNAPLPCVNK